MEIRAQCEAAFLKERFEANHADILLHVDRAEEASELAAQAATSARKAGALWALPWAERIWGCALARLGVDATEVDAHLGESLSVANEVGNVMEALQTEIAWAQVCLDRHDLTAASTLFRKARDRITDEMLPCTQAYFLPRIDGGLSRCETASALPPM